MLSRSTRVVEGKTNGRAFDRIDLLTSQKPQKNVRPNETNAMQDMHINPCGYFRAKSPEPQERAGHEHLMSV